MKEMWVIMRGVRDVWKNIIYVLLYNVHIRVLYNVTVHKGVREGRDVRDIRNVKEIR